MGRLLLIVIAAIALVAIVAILLLIWNAALAAGTRGLRPLFATSGDDKMAPSGFQKVAFLALILLLLGVSLGWLGGL
jgi:hypothetical protein